MDAELIRRWNETVPEDAIIFHLGDFGSTNYKRGLELLKTLHGRKYLIIGNHDHETMCRGHVNLLEGIAQQMDIKICAQRVVLNHCPLLCFPDETQHTWQLFGHVHSGPLNTQGNDMVRLKYLWPHQYDVGVDNNDYRSISFPKLKAILEMKPGE